ncbi:MAG: DUF2764 family protein [Bacteroidales bacterium]|nr:DUF2764 family protein [Bacteroidales bacterium]
MSHNYYCLVAGMPEIAFDQKKLVFKADELKEYLRESLRGSDLKELRNLYYEYDNHNILGMLFHDDKSEVEFNNLANYTYDELLAAFKDPNEIDTDYIARFFEEYNDSDRKDDRLYWEKRLTQAYYEHIGNSSNRFIRNWFSFEFMLKNVMSAIIARKYGLDNEDQLIVNSEPLQLIAKSNAKDFGLSVDWPMINTVINIFDNSNLFKREEEIDRLKWKWLDEATTFEYFSFEVVIAILLKLRIIERWVNADPGKGKTMFRDLIEDIKNTADLDNNKK